MSDSRFNREYGGDDVDKGSAQMSSTVCMRSGVYRICRFLDLVLPHDTLWNTEIRDSTFQPLYSLTLERWRTTVILQPRQLRSCRVRASSKPICAWTRHSCPVSWQECFLPLHAQQRSARTVHHGTNRTRQASFEPFQLWSSLTVCA